MTYQVILFTDGNQNTWHSRPAGAQRLATHLRHAGYTVLVVDYFSLWLESCDQLLALLDRVTDHKTLLYGFSSTYFNTTNTQPILNYRDYYRSQELNTWPLPLDAMASVLLRMTAHRPQVRTVYGGYRFDHTTDRVKGMVDYTITGYAEQAVVELLEKICAGASRSAQVQAIERLMPNFSTSTIDYDSSDAMVAGAAIAMETSRGCMFQCDYCAYPLLARGKDTAYHKTASTFAAELRANHDQFGAVNYTFTDSIFNESVPKLENLLRARDQSGVDIRFSAFIRYELIRRWPAQLGLLRDLGLQGAMIGIESFNHSSARSVGKGTDPQLVKDCLSQIKQYFDQSVSITGQFILGLPHETPHTAAAWLDWISQPHSDIDVVFMSRMDLQLLGQSLMRADPGSYGYTAWGVRNDYSYWRTAAWSSVDADRMLIDFMTQQWDSGRLRVGSYSLQGLQGMGMTFDQCLTTPMRDLDHVGLHRAVRDRFERYRAALIAM